MEFGFVSSLDRPSRRRDLLRPAAIWLGLSAFLVGSIILGDALAAGDAPFLGPLLLSLGVALVGGGLATDPVDVAYDPEVSFSGPRRYFIAAVSTLFFLLVAAALALTVL